MKTALALATVCLVSIVEPAAAATVTFLPAATAYQVAGNRGSGRWNGIAQSITAVATNVTFGFYLYGAAPSSVLYSLYAGDGVFGTALKKIAVTSPQAGGLAATLVSADFSDVRLTIGQRYTFRASLPSEDYPATGTYSIAHAALTARNSPFAAGPNAYKDGRFYFTGSPFSPEASAGDDLAFSMSGVTPAGVPEPASWALMIGGLGAVGGTLRRRARRPALA